MNKKYAKFLFSLALVAASHMANAALINFAMTDSTTSTVRASGNFSFSDALQGSVIGYGNLSSFNLTANNVSYNLAFINSGAFSQFYTFQFDTSTDSFLTQTVSGFPSIMEAIKADFSAGFFIRPLGNGPLVTEYSQNTFNLPYDTLTVSRESTAIPEPGSLALLGLGLAGLAVIRKRKQA